MAAPNFDIERAARAIVRAHMKSDAEAARDFGVARETIVRWRKRAEHDRELSQLVTGYLSEARQADEWDWLTDLLRTTARAGVDLLERIKDVPAEKLPEAVEAMAGFLREAGVYEQTRRVIDAKLKAMQPEPHLPTQQAPGFRAPHATA